MNYAIEIYSKKEKYIRQLFSNAESFPASLLCLKKN